MNEFEVQDWLDDRGGIASTAEVAGLLEMDDRCTRELAGRLRVRTIGTSYVWTLQDILAALDQLDTEEADDAEDGSDCINDDEEDDDEEDDDEEDDEGDEDEEGEDFDDALPF